MDNKSNELTEVEMMYLRASFKVRQEEVIDEIDCYPPLSNCDAEQADIIDGLNTELEMLNRIVDKMTINIAQHTIAKFTKTKEKKYEKD